MNAYNFLFSKHHGKWLFSRMKQNERITMALKVCELPQDSIIGGIWWWQLWIFEIRNSREHFSWLTKYKLLLYHKVSFKQIDNINNWLPPWFFTFYVPDYMMRHILFLHYCKLSDMLPSVAVSTSHSKHTSIVIVYTSLQLVCIVISYHFNINI
jgi:hypothetical protein